ncbi:A-kinase anchor protein SPHKAP isoform X3 [Manis pentadactyla]|uniref:A-kinase anchor protein SPHKAP isoform X3 n=1 Tax=Manis pentadactyla TaxID=143292 RepID=UPI00255C92DB|nr:A-kinase anchor protein SPHKAP isoform X3 [Manis pentadactyla]
MWESGEQLQGSDLLCPREKEGRRRKGRAGREKFGRIYPSWVPGAAGKAWEPLASEPGCRGGGQEPGTAAGALAKRPAETRGGAPGGGGRAQRFPAGEGRGSRSPRRPTCAPRSARPPGAEFSDPGPLTSGVLSAAPIPACLPRAPADDDLQLAALCAEVLCSNSLLESTDYWLQNQRTPCQIGFVEDKSENCASVCFVNLDVNKDEHRLDQLQQKLVNVSPDLPKLISSMNVQQPKENEIVLLSGLASGNLQTDFEVSQCPWLPDICLVQCARGSGPNSTNCIIFEINKFLIGLELVQERQLHLETNILKVEDDTNCSLSSIEEDFLTASEHLEEESEVEEYRNGYENINVSASALENKMTKEEATQEEWDYHKEKSPYAFKGQCSSKCHTPPTTAEGSLERVAEDTALQSLHPLAPPSGWEGEAVGKERPPANDCHSENGKGQVEKSQFLYIPGDAYFSKMVKKDRSSACGTITEHDNNLVPRTHEDGTGSPPDIQGGEATTGEYATNLAESVLQDAFIGLSQCRPIPPQELAVTVSAGSGLLPSGCSTEDMGVPQSWNELPKIVIVQSPDGSDAAPGPGTSSQPKTDISVEALGILSGENSSRGPQSALEVALACAATVIGTISSPQATERLKIEQESLVFNHPLGDNEPLQTQISQVLKEPSIGKYSFSSALCGMTQVASAVAVCGLGETGEVECPVASSGLLFAAETPAAVPPLCSLGTGRSMELGNEAIVEALLKEATLVLTRPDTYSSTGDLMESMSGRIMEAASKPQALCSENVLGNELAQTLSSVILKHAVDEAHQKNKIINPNDSRYSSETLDTLMESINQLLFSVICFTFRKMNHIVQLGQCSTALSKETLRWRETELGCQPPDRAASQTRTKATEGSSSHPLSSPCSTSLAINDLVEDACLKQDSKCPGKPGLLKPTLPSELSCSPRAPDYLTANTPPREIYLKGAGGEDTKDPHSMMDHSEDECRAPSEKGRTLTVAKCSRISQDAEDTSHPEAQEKYDCASPLNSEVQVNLSLSGNDLLPAQSMLQTKHAEVYGIPDFAEDLAEMIVSMATEIAAICLDNSNGKQPWFCAWKQGTEFLVTPNVSCRSLKRKKESQARGATVRKHKPPRLSEIKRKTDEHPELKEKLMNRVVDESMNLEDVPDSVNIFANEVAAKIMNLTEFSVVDSAWQAQSSPRNRLLGGDRWSRLKASSCESIPEEDSNARAFASSLGLMSTLSQPVSRASSVSKQSSCESITDEFSRFMVNQMENEGRGFDLLLDYYAGKNASSILNSAMQQACRKNDHLSVRPSCPSKQSSTESITEEFYRYMLRDIERESRDSAPSRRSSQDWSAGLLSPAVRSPLCYRQSSMPDSRSLGARLTVNAPVKANSLDGFGQNSQQDFLSIQPVSSVSFSGLCKSDSCLYQRGGTDRMTDMLIHETWANSIEALMRKNKIITDDAGAAGAEPAADGSRLREERSADRTASSRGRRGPALGVQESPAHPRKDSITESQYLPVSAQNKAAPLTNHSSLDSKKDRSSCHDAVRPSHARPPLCSREVPLIQIETEQREECGGEPEHLPSKSSPLEEAEEASREENVPDVARGGDAAESACQNRSDSLDAGDDVPEAEVSTEGRAPDELPTPAGSSGESTDSWSQLANEEDNPDDPSSFLQLSERSMSELVEEKEILKGQSENIEERGPGVPAGAASCQGSLLVINFDLEPACPDTELRATLQWIAASELGIPTIYFKKSQESRIEKFLDVVQLVHQKSWKVGDIFHAVVQYCKMHEERKAGTPSLFDWLLELG